MSGFNPDKSLRINDFVSPLGGICISNANSGLEELVHNCHSQGKKVRLWATPENETIWQQLRQANVDLINTDSLARLASHLQLQNQVLMNSPE